MSIASLDQWIASAKQRLSYDKTASGGRTTVAGAWFSLFDLAGSPGAGVLAGGETTPPANTIGRVPTDAIPGYPVINAFGGGAIGYLGRVFVSNSVQSRVRFFDRLFCAGPYNFNAAVTLASQPSYSSRVPGGGTDFTGLELWLEQVTAGTLVQNVAVTYTDQSGNAAHTTGTFPTAVNIVGRTWQIPLQGGDSGLRTVETVTGSVASAGTFNIMVLRPLLDVWISTANEGRIYDLTGTGMPQVFTDSAIYGQVLAPSGTTSGLPYCDLDVVNG